MDPNQNTQTSPATSAPSTQNNPSTPQNSQPNPQPVTPQAPNPLFENPDTVEFKGSSKINT